MEQLIERKRVALRRALFVYLAMLGNLNLRDRIEADTAFKAVRAGLLHSGSVLQLTRTEADAVKSYLLAEQYQMCKLCGHKLSNKGAVLDHDHLTGRVRGVLSRSANGAEGGRMATGKLGRMDKTTLTSMIAQYRRTVKPTDLLYPLGR